MDDKPKRIQFSLTTVFAAMTCICLAIAIPLAVGRFHRVKLLVLAFVVAGSLLGIAIEMLVKRPMTAAFTATAVATLAFLWMMLVGY